MSVEQDVRRVVTHFYAALNRTLAGDPTPMFALWAVGWEVSLMPSSGGRRLGHQEVRSAWGDPSQLLADGRIELEEPVFRLLAPEVALVTGIERGGGTVAGKFVPMNSRMTLVLRREGSDWRAVHHHVELAAGMRGSGERPGA